VIYPIAYIGPGAGFAFLGSFLAILLSVVLTATSVLIWPFRAAWHFFTCLRSRRKAKARKLIFLGLDGLDPGLTEKFMAEGKLPNLSRLMQQGGFRRLRTTFPALSPVAWSTFATGVNPARHNIFDFLNRDLKSYLPELSSSKVSGAKKFWQVGRYRIPLEQASVELRRKSRPFWKILGEHHIGSTILRVPVTFPPEKFHGRLLSAMCTPDLKGTQGTFSRFTTRADHSDYTGGSVYRLERDGDHLKGAIEGPENTLVEGGGPLRVPFVLTPTAEGATLRIESKTYKLEPDVYSPWITLTFHAPLGVETDGIVRFLITETVPEFSMYVTPVHIDPAKPALPISHPSFYAMYLAKLFGSFATLGLAEDTWALNDGVISEHAFLEQTWLTHAERETMFLHALEHTTRGVVACVFDATDRVQHMFFRHGPGGVIEDLYRRADALVGKALPYVDAQTVLFVLSDHGFASFRRAVNLNAWLHQNGYLALKDDAAERGPGFQGVDWERTKAYALGLSGLYINKKGRESSGVVTAAAAVALEQELIGKLSNLRDDERGETAIRQVYATRALYQGPYLDAAPDLIVGYNDGYRTSWDAATGTVGRRVIEDNDKPWSGDHCIDPPLVPGVLFSNRAIDSEDPGIEDLAPTALDLFGIRTPEWMEGKPVFRSA
jgi:predicted AlkP superfamily phosphohydrolase/phosphomutase